MQITFLGAPIKKSEKLKRRQNKFILRNQPDLVEEKSFFERDYLDEGESNPEDEGESNSEDEAPEEISTKLSTMTSEDEYDDSLLDNFLSENKKV